MVIFSPQPMARLTPKVKLREDQQKLPMLLQPPITYQPRNFDKLIGGFNPSEKYSENKTYLKPPLKETLIKV